jgi:hypothetical protein
VGWEHAGTAGDEVRLERHGDGGPGLECLWGGLTPPWDEGTRHATPNDMKRQIEAAYVGMYSSMDYRQCDGRGVTNELRLPRLTNAVGEIRSTLFKVSLYSTLRRLELFNSS